ncbi:MAG: FAD-dependent oxidoreductase [Thermoleophilia bacterium]|nr:FAD-dependent oxidoreductase [Thermoleophilia bacterium]
MSALAADLVVVGAGGAGLPAAITALDQGVQRVVVLEKRKRIGGNAAMAGGTLFAVGSRLQLEAGIDVHAADVFRETMAYHHYDGVDPGLVRLFIDQSSKTIAWLEEHGALYRCAPGRDLVVEPAEGPSPPGSFGRVMDSLADAFEIAGGTLVTGVEVYGITRDDDGRIAGVLARNRDGEELVVSAGHVIIATGGFTGNRELLDHHFGATYDEAVYWTDSKRLTGDGIRIAESAGAAIDGRCFLIKENCYSFKTGKRDLPYRGAVEATCVWVNQRGERFLDESLGTVNASTNTLVAQPGMLGFALFDDALIRELMDQPDPFSPEPCSGEEGSDAVTPHGYRKQLRTTLADPANRDWSVAGDNWNAIATWIGAEPDVLCATISRYNLSCEEGCDGYLAKDPAFLRPLRTPPFYALKFRPLMIDTVGPLRVNERLEVLDPQARPIKGLLAAGVVTSGWLGKDEHLFGTPLSWALSSGLVAGAVVAQTIRGERRRA